jgi:hypothetical protein
MAKYPLLGWLAWWAVAWPFLRQSVASKRCIRQSIDCQSIAQEALLEGLIKALRQSVAQCVMSKQCIKALRQSVAQCVLELCQMDTWGQLLSQGSHTQDPTESLTDRALEPYVRLYVRTSQRLCGQWTTAQQC